MLDIILHPALLVIFALWAGFIAYQIHVVINKKLRHYEKLDPNTLDEYKPFQRTDYNRWRQVEMTLVGIFILPIRLFMIIVPMSIFVVVLQIAFGRAKVEDARVEYAPAKRFWVTFLCRYLSKIVVAGAGFYWIDRKRVRFSDFPGVRARTQNLTVEHDAAAAAKAEAERKRAPILISNHVSWLDIMYFCSTDTPSFLSKIEVSKYPLWGPASIAIQSIFVKRENSDNRDETKNNILDRCKQINEGKQLPPILIFPEGTTTNNKYLISFKRGAFEPFQPVKAFVLKYSQRNFLPSLDSLGTGYVSLLMLCQLYNKLTVYEFETMYPKSKVAGTADANSDALADNYARYVKEYILECGQFANSDAGYRHMRKYYDEVMKQWREKYWAEEKARAKAQ